MWRDRFRSVRNFGLAWVTVGAVGGSATVAAVFLYTAPTKTVTETKLLPAKPLLVENGLPIGELAKRFGEAAQVAPSGQKLPDGREVVCAVYNGRGSPAEWSVSVCWPQAA